MKLDGTEPQDLADYDHVLDISTVGDWLYYSGPDTEGFHKATLLRIDGSDRKDYFPE